MYEVVLGTSGLMQIGWCTASCKFTREEGVGDTPYSYAIDGYREAKWNNRDSSRYGEVRMSFLFTQNWYMSYA